MQKSKRTACPLDCYDACSVIYKDGLLKGEKNGHTQGFLCPHLNHYKEQTLITTPRYRGKEITLDEALERLKKIVSESCKDAILHYRGKGNFGLMQEVTDHFFASYGATLTDGTLCDGAGEAGIVEGRGSNKNMPLEEIAKSDVVIFWGRNPHVTSSHILPIIQGKKIIVIDPVETKIAKMADIYLQIKPHSDIYLALLLTRFLYIHEMCDEAFLSEYAEEFEEYYELTQTIRIKATLENIGVSLGDIGAILDIIHGKKVAIVCGVGLQKYRDGADVMRSIDALALSLGLFGKEGCGVSYLGNSQEGVTSPFMSRAKRVSQVNCNFSHYRTVFIQGANPLAQMPDSLRVQRELEGVANIIYFGLYENETSGVADLVIPAKTFLQKNDMRLSYSHNAFLVMPQLEESASGVSEYELSAYLCDAFHIELEQESFYLEHFKSFAQEREDGTLEVKGRVKIPYQDGFDNDDGKFLFLDEVDTQGEEEEGYFLITPKSPTSLNSQFRRQERVYLHSSLGFAEGEEVMISSDNGSVILQVSICDDLRGDCVMIYSGTKGVNNLTTSRHSYAGKSAIFQENRVRVQKKKG